MFINTDIATEQLRRQFKNLTPRQTQQSIFRALNKSINQGKTVMSQQIRSVYNISVADVNKNTRVNLAHKDLTWARAELLYSVIPLPIAKFNPEQVNKGVSTRFVGSRKKGGFASAKTKKQQEGVYVTIKKGDKKPIKSAFLSFSGKNDAGVSAIVKAFGKYNKSGFQFNDSQTGPSRALKSKSVYYMAISDNVLAAGAAKMKSVYYKNLFDQLRRGVKYGVS